MITMTKYKVKTVFNLVDEENNILYSYNGYKEMSEAWHYAVQTLINKCSKHLPIYDRANDRNLYIVREK